MDPDAAAVVGAMLAPLKTEIRSWAATTEARSGIAASQRKPEFTAVQF